MSQLSPKQKAQRIARIKNNFDEKVNSVKAIRKLLIENVLKKAEEIKIQKLRKKLQLN